MENYPELRKLSYRRPPEDDAEYQRRFNSPGCVKLDFHVGKYPLFYVITPDLIRLEDHITQAAYRIQALTHDLPNGATAHFIRSLIADETVATNSIEAIHSTRKEALEALDAAPSPSVRLSPLVHLLTALSDAAENVPFNEPADVRKIYDDVTAGEVAESDSPDGKLFRAQPVHVMSSAQKALHTGFQPEERIHRGISAIIREWKQPSSSRLMSAIIGHLMFEIVHPFYDGNGRTGRFLLARQIAELGWPITALGVSSQIDRQKAQYYEQFLAAEHPLNRGEATHFLAFFLELIHAAQNVVLDQLNERRHSLDVVSEKLRSMDLDEPLENTLWILAQVYAFGADDAISRNELGKYLQKSTPTTVAYLNALDDAGWIEYVKRRPVMLRLSTQGAENLGILRAY
ncbi:Fic family protein [Arcanobacterium wilhelmae]|uniref:Fic family protein n=1 Tax=Arcanobacterium wilhelmae TaxID=1803177 RepID=A0ABT9N938_9ACTO|nr:Fic family protein [Arcanobacterium wilhelmae]MDP9800215.1 Fic family protein [Arcanobacterium wilhelmae]WFN89655.1 Fic family protein [Arcanobacterium wilhelmae]